MPLKWSILILTQEPRRDMLNRLLLVLGPQVADNYKDVEILVRDYDPSISLGANRQRLLDAAEGSYVNFVDDDDLVPFDYVRKILPHLNGKNDYIGFRVALWMDNNVKKPAIHSLKCKMWAEDDRQSYRDISHLNPIKLELAKLGTFEGGIGEDYRWAKQLRETGLVRQEAFIDEEMYLYLYRSRKGVDGRV